MKQTRMEAIHFGRDPSERPLGMLVIPVRYVHTSKEKKPIAKCDDMFVIQSSKVLFSVL